ncbi:MAG TPA: hypothetical protein GXZ30_01415, partial [Propionibacterium sp.]|nr:hypothetical protein [Propionibacterium sp.]
EAAAFAPGPVPAAAGSGEIADDVVRRLRAGSTPWRRAVWAVSPVVWLKRGPGTRPGLRERLLRR